MFGSGALEPIAAAVAVLIAGRCARLGVPVWAFPARRFAVAGPGRDQPVVQGRAANAARGFELAVGKVRGVEQAQALGNPFAQVVAVALEGHVAAHVHFPQIGRGMAVAYPVRDHLADAAGGLQAD